MLLEWTKRLGQQHYYESHQIGGIKTLCDMPMLGNNYAKVIREDSKTPCKECQDAIQRKR